MDDLSLPYSINRESIESEDYEISGESRPSIEIIRSSNRQSNSSSPSVHSFRISYQKRALFRKSVSLQMRQIGTNILQMMTPVIGLALVVVIKYLANWQIDRFAPNMNIGFPFLFNMPYSALKGIGFYVNISNCDQWYMYSFAEDADEATRAFVGFNNGTPQNDPSSEGMLHAHTNILEGKCPEKNKSIPYFEKPPVNLTIDEYLYETLEKLNKDDMVALDYMMEVKDIGLLPDGAITFKEVNDHKLKYNLQINDKYYYQYHRNNGITKLGVILNNKTIAIYRTIEGQLSLADLINKAYFREFFPHIWTITGVQYMPMKMTQEGRINRLLCRMGAGIFPLCLALLLPVFMYSIVLEKEEKLIQMMRMNGMKMFNYWFINFCFDYILYIFTAGIFIIFGFSILQIQVFIETSPTIMFFMLVGWGYSQIALAFFFSVFLNKAQTATIAGYMLSLWTTVVALSLNSTLFEYPREMPSYLSLYPTFAFARIFYRISYACGFSNCVYDAREADWEINYNMSMLYVMPTVFLILAVYLNEIVPQDYGVARHPLFFTHDIKMWWRKLRGRDTELNEGGKTYYNEKVKNFVDEIDLSMEDEDVKNERSFVNGLDYPFYEHPLVIKDLRKIYRGVGGAGPKLAVRQMSISIRAGEMFGLLGPNGAGKTTLISMLTGLYKPTYGNAWIGGYDIKAHLDQVQYQMGFCPQFDILWPDLTVEEHLLFYARLKGTLPKDEKENVKRAIEQVYLHKFSTFKTKQLSGGMKRRLSVAISLVGNPKIVFLDEPTTGLDPENRRQLWDILVNCRATCSIMLTTHSMEEADVLCSRIGIVSNGTLRCIGGNVHLKSKYGGGYHLFVNSYQAKFLKLLKTRRTYLRRSRGKIDPAATHIREIIAAGEELKESTQPSERKGSIGAASHEFTDNELLLGVGSLSIDEVHRRVQLFIIEILPNAQLLQAFNGNFIYAVPLAGFNASRLFHEMEDNKKRLLIADWGISQCSLEDVFTKICMPREEEDEEEEEGNNEYSESERMVIN